jgi:hypothetical protein
MLPIPNKTWEKVAESRCSTKYTLKFKEINLEGSYSMENMHTGK